MQMMIKDLSSFDLDKIEYAFNVWRQESEKIPTVASILKIIHGTTEKKNVKEIDYKSELTHEGKKFIENAFYEAKKFLHEHEGVILNKPEGCPPWYGLSWEKIKKHGFIPQIEKHLHELERTHGKERSEGYLLYLKTNASNYEPKNLYKN